MSEAVREDFSRLHISDELGDSSIVNDTEYPRPDTAHTFLTNRYPKTTATDMEPGVKRVTVNDDEPRDSKEEEASGQGAKRTSACPNLGTSVSGSNRREHWIYGYHHKNRNLLRIAKQLGLPWREPTVRTIYGVRDHIDMVSQVPYRSETIRRGGRAATVFYFAEDDQRKRLRKLRVSRKEMDRVRKAMGLRKGTKPKWYDCNSMKEDESADVSSDDEDLPKMKGPVFRNPPYSLPSWMVVNDEDADRTVDMDCEHYGGSVTEVDPHDNPEL